MNALPLPQEWQQTPAEFSLAPFWFWNDDLDEAELSRQLDAFQAHGVDAFVLHPRLGLPEHLGWMSRGLLDKMRFGIAQAKSRGMWVILYDEGMYPSGASSGQVVAENAEYQCRGMVRINLDTVQPNSTEAGVRFDASGKPVLSASQSLVAEVGYQGNRYVIVDRPIDAVIRGLHFLDENVVDETGESPENGPLASDLLNPDAVACYIRLVYDRFYAEFGPHFGSTIPAIFTDEPMLLGRPREKDIFPGTRGILGYINNYLGYNFTPFLPALWDENAPENIRHDFERAVEHRLEQTYYAQLYDWCDDHGIALTGHPAEPDATRHLRYFHFPGQDIVWRQIEPDQSSALEGRQSTQAKAASSMMLHTRRRRNANEFCGAYGHTLTFDEMRWLANWLLIRGCNLLIPHAFYYSVRGPRKDERPPDVGLHSAWWDTDFADFAHGSRRLCWLNTDSEHICHVAILGEHHHLPQRAAKACFQHQIDFNYLDVEDLARCIVNNRALHIAQQMYQVLVIDGPVPANFQSQLDKLSQQLAVVHWTDDAAACITLLKDLLPASVDFGTGTRGLRVRHIRKQGFDWLILFNEANTPVTTRFEMDSASIINPYTNTVSDFTGDLVLPAYELCVLVKTIL